MKNIQAMVHSKPSETYSHIQPVWHLCKFAASCGFRGRPQRRHGYVQFGRNATGMVNDPSNPVHYTSHNASPKDCPSIHPKQPKLDTGPRCPNRHKVVVPEVIPAGSGLRCGQVPTGQLAIGHHPATAAAANRQSEPSAFRKERSRRGERVFVDGSEMTRVSVETMS